MRIFFYLSSKREVETNIKIEKFELLIREMYNLQTKSIETKFSSPEILHKSILEFLSIDVPIHASIYITRD